MEGAMKFVVFDDDGLKVLGVVHHELVFAVADLLAADQRAEATELHDVAEIAGVEGLVPRVAAALFDTDSEAGRPLAGMRLHTPIAAPGRVIGVGLNYGSHAQEQGAKIPRQPILFAKWTGSVTGPDVEVAIPYAGAEVDYECEVVVVIGRSGKDIPRESALDHVFGITAMNDLSDRKAQLAERQWTRAKSFDGFAPLGPSVVTLDGIASVSDLSLSTTLNGVMVQQGNTSDLIFDIPTLVSFASQGTTLQPGDLIATGTPGGVGFVKQPPVYLEPGDTVTVTVEYVGELTTTIVAGPSGTERP
jgi:2-keto-4-pentenoate hydratase/2-oxohepta-3-ene-1,7-dioic acid hydratase in catechol pathway